MSKSRVAERSASYALQAAMEPVFGPSFDLLATAPRGVAKLRELILSLAVRGKLLPQNSDDESVHASFGRFQMARLVVEEKANRGKPPSVVTDDERPFEVPSTWQWLRVADLCSVVTDGEHLTPQRVDDRNAIPLVTAKNVRNGYVDYAVTDFVPVEVAAKCWTRCKPECMDILMVSVGATLGRLAILREAFDMVLVRSVTLLRPMPTVISSDYLALHLRSPGSQDQIWRSVKQSAQPCLYLAKTGALTIALPPLAEQDRIVARVEELMQLCDALEAHGRLQDEQHVRLVATLFDALAASASAEELAENWQRIATHFDLLLDRPESVDALEQTLLQLAVRGLLVPQDSSDEPATDLLARIRAEKDQLVAAGQIKRDKLAEIGSEEKYLPELPRGWEWASVASIAIVGTGTTPSRTNQAYFSPAAIPWVTSGETGQPFIAKTEQAVSLLALRETNLTVYPSGTLIVAMYGQGKTRGQVSELLIEATTNQACAAIVAVISDAEHRRYLKLFFEKIYDEIRGLSAGGAQPNLNVGKVKATLIPLPPLAEQHRIVARVEQLRRLCADLRERLQQARATQSRLADALVSAAAQSPSC
jgi:type I restriction enzyme, S subunit